MNEMQVFGGMLGILATTLGIGWKIRDEAKKQANEFAVITKTFNESVNRLNVTIAEINTTLSFYKNEIDRISNRATTHGKELDELNKIVALNADKLERIEKIIDRLEGRKEK